MFAQVNIPVFSEMNAIPFFRLDFEASWRHDQYSDFGGTSNQKIGFNWAPIDDLTLRSGWGTSFRAPNFGENSAIVNLHGTPLGCPRTSSKTTPRSNSMHRRPAGGGFGFGKIVQRRLRLQFAARRNVVQWRRQEPRSCGLARVPQSGWAGAQTRGVDELTIGFDYSPSSNFLTGLNLQATYYIIKINGVLVGFGNPTSSRFSDSAIGFAYIVPSDLRDDSGTQLCPGMDATPWLCPESRP